MRSVFLGKLGKSGAGPWMGRARAPHLGGQPEERVGVEVRGGTG